MGIQIRMTHIGQHTHSSSSTLWRFKTTWIRSLYHKSIKICSNKVLFNNQIQIIYKLMVLKVYPKYIRKSILYNTGSNLNKTKLNRSDET